MGKKTILVTGVGGSAGMNFVQSLRLADKDIVIIGTDCSKYYARLSVADRTYVVPSCNDPMYLHAINDIIINEGVEFIHAQPDPEVKFLSDHREDIAAKIFLPERKTIDIAQDKYRFNKLMYENCVSVPMTRRVKDPDYLRKYFAMSPGKLWLRAAQGAGSLAALPVTNYDQAYTWIEYWRTRGLKWEDFILSEFLPGKEYAFQSLWKDGMLITSAARQRIEYLFQNRMPSGQSSTPTIARSVHNELVNFHSIMAIKTLDPNATGIFCVDLKEDKYGVPHITEINVGRFFTTSLFFAKAGSNMPYYYIKMAYGEDPGDLPEINAVPEGLYWIRQIDCSQIMVKEDELNAFCINYSSDL